LQEFQRWFGGGQLSNVAHFALDFSPQRSVCGGHGQRA
jgi:hypothetical protein